MTCCTHNNSRASSFKENYFFAELPANFEASQDITICEVIEASHYSVQAIVLYNSYCVSVSQVLKETVEGSEVFKETYYIKELVINDTDDTTESVMSEFHKDMDLDDEDSSSSSLLHNSNYTAESDMGLDGEDLSYSSQLHNEDSIFDYESPVLERETNGRGEHTELVDPFYEEYAQRMKWFDLLNYERTCGIGAIFNSQLESHLIEPIEPLNLFLPYIALSKVSRRKMLRSLESDFELVYVGQTCLCWEALHRQYLKIEALANSGSKKGVFYDNVAGNFQKFQVLLERFMEDERTKGKRYWNYVQGRFPLKSLLQVPEISGYYEEEQEGLTGQCTKIRDVLKAIEKSINALWVFLKTDNSESWWKLRKIVWTFQPVEDPKDLKLLADLKRVFKG
ncbi:hypothetical protein Scep_017332 [Stephania cephalantha]|uniref:Uncharacterized protein n=1 Tax=Stephania cephalantha TaxID=152367 RepID=A0AAP0IPD7_9MAGN